MKRFSGILCAGLSLLLAACAPEPKATQPATGSSTAEPAKIVMFYPGQPEFAPGDRAQVCYGVQNAASVRFDPPVEEIKPLSNKCVWFQPQGSMELTLIAVGEDGNEVRETIPITVKAGAPSSTRTAPAPSSGGGGEALIQTFVATASSISPGGGSTICYVLSEAATLKMDPPSGDLGTELKKCVLVRPKATTTYTLIATANGRTDKASVTVKVE